MARRLEVCYKKGITDLRGEALKSDVLKVLGIHIGSIKIVDVYNIEFSLFDIHLKKLGEELFSDPIIEEFSFKEPLAKDFNFIIEVSFKPFAVDNLGIAYSEVIKDLLGIDTKVFYSKQYLLKGKISKKDAELIAREILSNESIQNIAIFDKPQKSMTPLIFKAEQPAEPLITGIDLNVSDKELLGLIKNYSLDISLENLKNIKDYFKQINRQTNEVEIKLISKALSKEYYEKIVLAKISFNDGESVRNIDSLDKTFFNEVYNTPKWKSFLNHASQKNILSLKFNKEDSIILNVSQKCAEYSAYSYNEFFNLGIKSNKKTLNVSNPLFSSTILCLPPKNDKNKGLKNDKTGLINFKLKKAVNDASRTSLVPIAGKLTLHDELFSQTQLSYNSVVGIINSKSYEETQMNTSVNLEDLIVVIGKRSCLSNDKTLNDAVFENKLTKFVCKARELKNFKTIIDDDKKGLIFSLISKIKSGIGLQLQIDKIPLKNSCNSLIDIICSASDESAILIVDKYDYEKILTLAKNHGLKASIIGIFDNSKKINCTYKGRVVVDIDVLSIQNLETPLKLEVKLKPKAVNDSKFNEPKSLDDELKKVLTFMMNKYENKVFSENLNNENGLCNFKNVSSTIIMPYLSHDEGVSLTQSIKTGFFNDKVYDNTLNLIDNVICNHVSKGGDLKNGAMMVNFNLNMFGKHDEETKLAKLITALYAFQKASMAFEVPLIFGECCVQNTPESLNKMMDSSNTAVMSLIGRIEDVNKVVSSKINNPHSLIYVVGKTRNELLGSEYYLLNKKESGSPPTLDFKNSKKIYDSIKDLVKKNIILSSHACSKGGLIVSLIETSCFTEFGVEVDLSHIDSDKDLRNDLILFSESLSRFIITIDQKDKKKFEEAMKGNSYSLIGKVTKIPRLVVKKDKKNLINQSLSDLQKLCGVI